MFFLFLAMLSLLTPALGTTCDDISCSNVNDYVCASVETRDGTEILLRYQNICFMRRKQCQLRDYVVIKEISHRHCNIQEGYQATTPMPDHLQARRVQDFSIVGAHQTCNHTCPTYCTDSYDPACAQIWKREGRSYTYRPMINHCHIDLFSCASGLNVTIQPLGKCYKNPAGLLFMMQVAALKSLKLLDDGPFTEESRKSGGGNKQLWEVVERLFEKISERKNPLKFKHYGRTLPLPRSKENKAVTPPFNNEIDSFV